MHRLFLLMLLSLLGASTAWSQDSQLPYAEFKFGGYTPKDADFGNMFGITLGRKIDDRLYCAVEGNYYKSNYRKETRIADFDTAGISFDERQVELDFTTRIFMLFGKLDYELKLGQTPFYFRSSGGLGLEFIWNNENNFVNDTDRTRLFWGFGYKLSAGVGIKISRMGLLFIDGIYNDASATRERASNQDGLPVFQNIDVSGFGFLIGVNIINVGF